MGKDIVPVDINEELKNSYIDYAMSVISMRALPDVRDGLKPVHRRILYSMYEQNNTWNKPYKKSARIVGDVLGKYHPHGDSSVYDALVRLAQDFSLRYPLVDGQGNFGSIDGDSPAAMRYTEVRMAKIADLLLENIEEDTVDFMPNYDNSEKEPTVLPTVLPQLLVNGQSGIAVGMATNIPPHNLGEVLDALIYLLDHEKASSEELMQFIQGPDFPTGGVITGRKGIYEAYTTGRGTIIVRGRANIETLKNGREQIVITELPYMVNKANLIERIAELVKEEEVQGIADIRDESNKEGIRIVIEIKKNENAQIILNNLYKRTRLQDSFGINIVCLVRGVPKVLTLKECLEHFRDHRIEVVTRRTTYRLRKAQERLHILEGLKIAVDNIDAVVALIRHAESPDVARAGLIERYQMSEKQASAILEMRLARLTGLEREKILLEHQEVSLLIQDLQDILAKPERVREIIKEEFLAIRKNFADARRTEIVSEVEDIDLASLVTPTDVFVTLSDAGYIKRVDEREFRSQGRAGKGKSGANLKENDVIKFTLRCHTHDKILMFSNLGKVYSFFVYEIAEAPANGRGKSLSHLLTLQEGESITVLLSVREFNTSSFVFMVTARGIVKKTELDAFSSIRASGLKAINLDEGDALVGALITSGNDEVILATQKGQAIRFAEDEVRNMGRSARGVMGIDLEEDDCVVACEVVHQDEKILTVTELGYGKCSALEEYRRTSRACKGVKTINITEKNGCVAALLSVRDSDDVMLTTNTGRVIRICVKDIATTGRVTQGIRLMKVMEGEKVVSVCKPNEYDDVPVTHLESTEEED